MKHLLFYVILIFAASCLYKNNKSKTSESSVFTLKSNSFTNNGTIPSRFSNKNEPQCSGNNDFPHLLWENAPSGTKSFVLIIEDETASNWVHLNLYDISSTTKQFDEMTATMLPGSPFPSVTFSSGTLGDTTWHTPSWAGPCPPSGKHKYVFKIYALNITHLDAPLNDTTQATFEATLGEHIIGSATLSGFVEK